jgi:hypothetical protein
MTPEQIVEREFRKAAGILEGIPITVVFTEDETIDIDADGIKYQMQIGSDDDGFSFVEQNVDTGFVPFVVEFAFPRDWPTE